MKHDYWCWKNYLTQTQIKNINRFIMNSPKTDEPRTFEATDLKGNKQKELKTSLVKWNIISPFFPTLWDIITQTNLVNFGYDITPLGITNDNVHYNVYSSKTKDTYNWHIDAVPDDRMDIKFTVLINISEIVYKGGQFKLLVNNEHEIPELNTPGNMVMFKSFLHHKVEKVTSGERKSLSLFVKGPAFK